MNAKSTIGGVPGVTESKPAAEEPKSSATKAIFTDSFHFNRKGSNESFLVHAAKEPQTFPRDVIEAAIKAGKAEPVSK